jgi:hypothetical protein
MSEKILMVTPDGETVTVDPKNFDAAIAKKLEPALEYVTPDGETVLVRKKNFDSAEKKGLVMKPLYEAKQTPMENPGKLAAGAAGFAQWTPLGSFREELSAGLQQPEGAVRAIGQLFGKGSKTNPKLKAYQDAKQQYKDIENAAWEQEPEAYSVGGIMSALSSGGAAKAGQIPSAARTLGASAGLGAASGIGEQEGDLKELLKAGTIGGASGLGLGAGAVGIQRMLSKSANPMASQAAKSAYSVTGGLKSDINKLYDNTPEQIGRELLDKDIVKFFTERGGDAIENRLQKPIENFSQEQSALLNSLDENYPDSFETRKLIEDLLSKSKEQYGKPGAGNRALGKDIRKEASIMQDLYEGFDEFGNRIEAPNMSLQEALQLKRAFDTSGKYQSPMSEMSKVAASREARSLARNQIDETVSNVAGKEVADTYRKSRESTSKLLSARDAIKEAQKRDQANLGIGLREGISGTTGATVGAAIGGPVGAITGAASGVILSKLSKKYGDAMAAVMLDRASKVFASQGFEKGMRTLIPIYGQEAAREIGNAIAEQVNFKNPVEKSAAFLLGPDVTKTVAATGAGLGYAMEGQPFAEGFGERAQQLDDIDSTGASIVSGLLPVGKAGKTVNMLMRGLNVADEYLSGSGGTKTAPMLKNIQMKNNDKYKSRVQNPKTVFSKIHGVSLKNDNLIKVDGIDEGVIRGYIDHPKYPEHTTFTIAKDKEGLWSVISNYRKDEFKDKPELRGSSTDFRNELAEILGGLGSDMGNRNTGPGLKSYFKDENAIPTRPLNRERQENEPFSKFFTPGSESQKKRFLKSYKESYKDTPKKPDFFKNQNGNRKIPDAVREAIESVEENNRINDASWSDWNSARHIADTYKIKMSPQDLAKLDTIMRERKRVLRINTQGDFTYKDGTPVDANRVRIEVMNDDRISSRLAEIDRIVEKAIENASSTAQLQKTLEKQLGVTYDNKSGILREFNQLTREDQIPTGWAREFAAQQAIKDALESFEPNRRK